MKKIVLTGATGFVGRHVCAALAAAPCELAILCRDDAHPALAWLAAKGVRPEVVALDLAALPGGNLYKRIGEPDVLIHLAWGGVSAVQSPAHLAEELPRHRAFLERLIGEGLPRLVVSGSCSEYGLLEGAVKETDPCDPSTQYGLAKYRLLQELETLRESRPFELLWARPFFMYGEGQNPGSIYPQLLRDLANNEAEFRMSGGAQVRDYLPVGEVARLIVALSLLRCTGIVNVCSGRPIALRDMVGQWLAERKASIRLNLGFHPYRDFEPMSFWGDTTRLHEYLRNP